MLTDGARFYSRNFRRYRKILLPLCKNAALSFTQRGVLKDFVLDLLVNLSLGGVSLFGQR
jgi:hypothetical protein